MITPSAWEPAPDNGVSQCMLAFCSHIFLLQMTPTSLSPKMTWFVGGGGGGALCKSKPCSSGSSIKFFGPQGTSVSAT